ncbi:MAG TPA: hypothetical protein VGA22_07270 [Gemmatimonadales bacterium]|jgi:hypothetical protein
MIGSDPFGGPGGPGMWDPMPGVPPRSPAEEVDETKLIWSRPPQEESPGAGDRSTPGATTRRVKKAASRRGKAARPRSRAKKAPKKTAKAAKGGKKTTKKATKTLRKKRR